MYQKDLFAKIKELTPIERYILCCNIIGKNKTDEILKDLAKHPLKRGFNPLTRVRHVKDIKKVYDGCYCPICGRPIKTSGYVFDDDFVESEVEE